MDVESPSTELSKLGAEALRDLYNNLAGVKAFALEQAPDVCQQMIRWQIANGILWAALLALFIIAWVSCAAYTWRKADDDGVRIGPWIVAGGSVITMFATMVITIEAFAPAFKACIAPKLFLLEKIAAMLKGLS